MLKSASLSTKYQDCLLQVPHGELSDGEKETNSKTSLMVTPIAS